MKNIIVIDIGGTNIRIGIFDQEKNLSHISSEKLPHLNTSEQLIKIISKKIEEINKKIDKKAHGISMSVAGPLRNNGKSFFFTAHNVIVDLVEPLEKKFSIPVLIANDTEAGVIATQKKDYPKTKNIAFITISTGIGVGAIINRQLISGCGGGAGEFGAIIIPASFFQKPLSWEEYCAGKRDSSTGIVNTYKTWALYNKKPINPNYLEPKDIFEAHKNKNTDIDGFMDEIGKINAIGVANVIFAYNPEIIVFGGSIAQNNYDIIIEGIEKYIDRTRISPLPKFAKSKIGDLVSLQGAGYNYLDKKII